MEGITRSSSFVAVSLYFANCGAWPIKVVASGACRGTMAWWGNKAHSWPAMMMTKLGPVLCKRRRIRYF